MFRKVPSQTAVLASDYLIPNSGSRKNRRVPMPKARKDCDNTCIVSVGEYKFTRRIRLLSSLENRKAIQAHSKAVQALPILKSLLTLEDIMKINQNRNADLEALRFGCHHIICL